MYPDSIKSLIECFKFLPGIGEKTAERLAFSVLELEEEQTTFFADSIQEVKSKIHKCKNCNTLTEDELCFICNDDSRNRDILCVVEDTKNVFLFERLGMYLIERIHKEKFQEIIFAFKPSIEGETTALYIKKILEDMDITITRLASGVPIGADMEYVDSLTLERALNDRKEIE